MPEISPTWQELRALRASPVDKAAEDDERRAVFSSSLRQAQELSQAAAVAGYATRPLPLFYCLSQGFRAIAAARAEDPWRIRGHGASVEPVTDLMDTRVIPRPTQREDVRDAFSGVQTDVDEEPMVEPMTLGAIWRASPQSPVLPSDVAPNKPRMLILHVAPQKNARERAESQGRIELAVEGLSPELSDTEVAEALARYPTLAGGVSARAYLPEEADRTFVYVTDRSQVTFSKEGRVLAYKGEWIEKSPVLSWPLKEGDNKRWEATFAALAPTGIHGMTDRRLVLPQIGGSKAPSYAALWWALFLALSSIVRYEPALWTAVIDPDRSRLAVPLEQACDFGEQWVPNLLKLVLVDERA